MRWAYLAAALALASAAFSFYWLVGGTALLDTVGGEIEELARERATGTVVSLAMVVLAKLFGAALALSLVQGWGERFSRRARTLLASIGGAVLALYGGVLVVAGALVLLGVIDASEDTDEHALRWHVFCWDLWFFVWGVALWVAARQTRSLGSAR
jgi:Protein of unknown function (DUF3995)